MSRLFVKYDPKPWPSYPQVALTAADTYAWAQDYFKRNPSCCMMLVPDFEYKDLAY